jgi:hypothetical protein
MRPPLPVPVASVDGVGAATDGAVTKPRQQIDVVDAQDVYKAAHLLVRQHGADAAPIAKQRHETMMSAGDIQATALWYLVRKAIDELQRVERQPGERAH